jgi:hypothetical protein
MFALSKSAIPHKFFNFKTLIWILLILISFYSFSGFNIIIYLLLAILLMILSIRSLLLFDSGEIDMILRLLNKVQLKSILFLK